MKPTKQATPAQLLESATIGGSPRDITDTMLSILHLLLPPLLLTANSSAGVALPEIGGYFVQGQELKGTGPFVLADSSISWQPMTPAGHRATLPMSVGLVSNASIQSRAQMGALWDAAHLVVVTMLRFAGGLIDADGQRVWRSCLPVSLTWGPQQWQQYGGPLLNFNITAPPGTVGTLGPAQDLEPTPIPDPADIWSDDRNLLGRPSLAVDAALDLLERMLPDDVAAHNEAKSRTLPTPNGYFWDGETITAEFPVVIAGVAVNYRPIGVRVFAADIALQLWLMWGPEATRPAKADVLELGDLMRRRLCGEALTGDGPASTLPTRLLTNQGGYVDLYCRRCWDTIEPSGQQDAQGEDPHNWRALAGAYKITQYPQAPGIQDNDGQDSGTDLWRNVIERKPLAPEFVSAAFKSVARGTDLEPEVLASAATGVEPGGGYPAIFEHEGDTIYLMFERHPAEQQVVVFLDVATPANQDLLLAWSYWDGEDWASLFFSDSDGFSIAGLTRSGLVRFDLPSDPPFAPTLRTAAGVLIDPAEQQPRIVLRIERTAADPEGGPSITPPTLRLARSGIGYGCAFSGDGSLDPAAPPEWLPGPLSVGAAQRVPLNRLAPTALQMRALGPVGPLSLDPIFEVIADCGGLVTPDKVQEWDGGDPLDTAALDLPNPNEGTEDETLPALFGVTDILSVDAIVMTERSFVALESA